MNFRSIVMFGSSSASSKSNAKREFAGAMRGTAAMESLENRRLLSAAIPPVVPAITVSPADQETLLGVFGVINGKRTTLQIQLNRRHTATFSLTKGHATVFQSSNGIDLEIKPRAHASLNVAVTRGGTVVFSTINIAGKLGQFTAPAGQLSGPLTASGSVSDVTIGAISGNVNFAQGVSDFTGGDFAGTFTDNGNAAALQFGGVSGNVNVSGNLSTFTANAVSGTIYSAGALGTATVGSLTGKIVAASQITSLSATSMTGATVLAGANLGTDGLLGGTGSAADTFGAGTIDQLSVSGAISSSFIGAGVNPVDGIFGNGNDTSAGASLIKTIYARSADSATRFESSAFGVAKFNKTTIVIATDPRFIIL